MHCSSSNSLCYCVCFKFFILPSLNTFRSVASVWVCTLMALKKEWLPLYRPGSDIHSLKIVKLQQNIENFWIFFCFFVFLQIHTLHTFVYLEFITLAEIFCEDLTKLPDKISCDFTVNISLLGRFVMTSSLGLTNWTILSILSRQEWQLALMLYLQHVGARL